MKTLRGDLYQALTKLLSNVVPKPGIKASGQLAHALHLSIFPLGAGEQESYLVSTTVQVPTNNETSPLAPTSIDTTQMSCFSIASKSLVYGNNLKANAGNDNVKGYNVT